MHDLRSNRNAARQPYHHRWRVAARLRLSPVVNWDGNSIGFFCLADLVPPVNQYFSEGIYVRDRTNRETYEVRAYYDDGDPSNA